MNEILFNTICDEVIGQQQGQNGIGTLSEKTVHAVVKNYIEPNTLHHEQRVDTFVADVFNGNEIYEIQTRSFDKLRRKLTAFLPIAPVTIVYPIHKTKWIRWVNPQTGEISPPRKSPKQGSYYVIFPELYKIKSHLLNPNLKLRIIMMDLEEYRFLDGWSQDKKKGSSKCDRIPVGLKEDLIIENTADYSKLIPPSLEQTFSSKDYKKCSGLSLSAAQVALNILFYVGAIDRVGKKGNSYLYKRVKDE